MGFFSKLVKAFTSLRLNPDSNLAGNDLKAVLVSAMYAEQQSAYLNSYETGIAADDAKTILNEYWGIYSNKDAQDTLEYLLNKGHRFYFPHVYAALTTEKNNYAHYLENAFTDKDDLEKAIHLFRSLRSATDTLIADKIIDNFGDTMRYGIEGWDFGRLAFIARLCYENQLLPLHLLKNYLQQALLHTKEKYSNWEDFSKSYIIGRALWGGQANSGMASIAHSLLHNEKSPWVKYPL